MLVFFKKNAIIVVCSLGFTVYIFLIVPFLKPTASNQEPNQESLTALMKESSQAESLDVTQWVNGRKKSSDTFSMIEKQDDEGNCFINYYRVDPNPDKSVKRVGFHVVKCSSYLQP